jgi:hypothetical protein
MREISIYINKEDRDQVEEEERNSFIKSILEGLDIPLEEVWPDLNLTVEQKVQLRNFLSKLDIEIDHDGDHGYKIFHNKDCLGQWFKPRFVLREDPTAKHISKRYFYEMIIKTDSVFEQGENNGEVDTVE